MIDADIDTVAGEVINVATGVDIAVAEIADMVLDALGKPASLKVHVDERPGQVDRHIGSTEKARAAARLAGAHVVRGRASSAPSPGTPTIAAWWESVLRAQADVFSS